MNVVILKGRLVKDVEIAYIPGTGTATIKNTIAVKRNYKNNDGQYESDFIQVVAFGKTAEFIANYFDKGQEIIVHGEIKTGSYENKEGNKVYTTEVIARNIEFCGSNNNNTNNEWQPEDDGDSPF